MPPRREGVGEENVVEEITPPSQDLRQGLGRCVLGGCYGRIMGKDISNV